LSAWKLTIRHGSDVEHEAFEDLDAAIGELRTRAEAVRAEGPLEEVSGLRDFDPAEQVHARLELAGKGLLRPPTAGVDVRGDGTLVAYAGAVRRETLEPEEGESPFDAVRRQLEGGDRDEEDREDD
jgi:hypothetical protein